MGVRYLDSLFGQITISDEGVALPKRPGLNFSGEDVLASDDPGSNRTDVTFNVSSAQRTSDLSALRLDVAHSSASMRIVDGHSSLSPLRGGGVFVFDPADTRDDDGGTIIRPLDISALDPGRWLRIYSGPLDVTWFGARGDNSTDDTFAIQSAISAAASRNGGAVYFPRGVYRTTGIDTAFGSAAENIVFSGDARSEPGLADSGSVIRASGIQAYVWKSRGRNLVYRDLTFDGNFAATEVVLFDYQSFECTIEGCMITRALEFTPVAITNVNTGTNTITAPGHGLVNGDRVHIESTGVIPSGCFQVFPDTFGWVFFVVNVSGSDFQLSLTSGGSTHALVTAGTGSRTVRKLGGTLLKCGTATNLSTDTCSVRNSVIVQDISNNDKMAAIGVHLFGSNTFQWRFDMVHFQNAFDLVYVEGGGGFFESCTLFGKIAFTRACVLKDGASEPVTLSRCYTEVDTVPIIVCLNQAGSITFDANNWTVENCYWNVPNGSIVWDCKQPLTMRGNVLGGNVRINAFGDQFVTSIGDSFSDEGGDPAVMDFRGALDRLWRVGTSHRLQGMQGTSLPDLFLSVKEFGAVGDGVVDDTGAFVAAIAAMGTVDELYLPPGKYRITSTIPLPANLTKFSIRGADPSTVGAEIAQRSVIYAAEITGYVFDPALSYGPGVNTLGSLSLQDVQIDGANGSLDVMNYSDTLLGAIKPPVSGKYVPNVLYRRVQVHGIDTDNAKAFNLQNAFFVQMENCSAWDIRNGHGIYSVGLGAEMTTQSINKCYLHGCKECFTNDANVFDIHIRDTVFESSMVAIASYDTNLQLDGCYFENIGVTNDTSGTLSKMDMGINDIQVLGVSIDIDSAINVRHGLVTFNNCSFNGVVGIATAWFRGVGLGQTFGAGGTGTFRLCRSTVLTDRFITDDSTPASRAAYIIHVDDGMAFAARGSIAQVGVITLYTDARLVDEGRIVLSFTSGANFRPVLVEGHRFTYGIAYEFNSYTAAPTESPDGGQNEVGDKCLAFGGTGIFTCIVAGNPGTWSGEKTVFTGGLATKQLLDNVAIGSKLEVGANLQVDGLASLGTTKFGIVGTFFLDSTTATNRGSRFVGYSDSSQAGFLGNYDPATGKNAYAGGSGFARFAITADGAGGDFVVSTAPNTAEGTTITLTERFRVKVGGTVVVAGLSTGLVHADGSGNLTSSTLVNADVNAAAAIAGSKISPDFGAQNVVTTGTGQFNSGGLLRGGSGAPESSVTGSPGDIYLRTTAGENACLYVKESGSATNTGWITRGSTIMTWGCNDIGTTANTLALYPGYAHITASGSFVQTECPRAGTLKNLRVHQVAGATAGSNLTFEVYKNSSATGLKVVLDVAGTSGSDTTHTVTVAAGDLIDVLVTLPNITTSPTHMVASLEYD